MTKFITANARGRIRLLSSFGLLLGVLTLSGCFVSTTSLIPAGDAVLPIDGPVTVCLEENDPCFVMPVSGDGYITDGPATAQGRLRLSPLTQAAGRQVYLAEAESQDGGFVYLLARRAPDGMAPTGSFELAGIDCGDLPETAFEAFEAAGGVYSGGFIKNCEPSGLDMLKATMIAGYGAFLADDAWWQEKGS